jgi:flagellar hook-basal body complex protein FliE
MCMCDNHLSVKTATAFLDDLEKAFLKRFSQSEIEHALAYSLNKEFKETIKDLMEQYNKVAESDAEDNIEIVKGRVNDISGVVVDAYEVMEENDKKIRLVVKKPEVLGHNTNSLYRNVFFII